MPLDIFHVKSLTVFLLCLTCVGAVTKITAGIANLQYIEALHYLTLFFAIRIMTAIAEFVNCLFGFVGVLTDNAMVLWRYTITMSLLVVFELMVMTFRYCNRDYLTLGYTNGIFQSKTMVDIERQYKCCGRSGSADYAEKNLDIPKSCYSKSGELNDKGCKKEIEFSIHERHIRGTLIFSIFILVELMALCSTARLAYRLSKERANSTVGI